jgi:hypothetical protein
MGIRYFTVPYRRGDRGYQPACTFALDCSNMYFVKLGHFMYDHNLVQHFYANVEAGAAPIVNGVIDSILITTDVCSCFFFPLMLVV